MAVRKVYRSVVAVSRAGTTDRPHALAFRSCDHTSRYHSTPEAAHTCLATRVREVLANGPLVALAAKIQYSHSRHDWFDA